MSWFQKELHVYADLDTPLSPEDRKNRFINLVEDEEFERVVIEIPLSEELVEDVSKTVDITKK